MAVGVVVPELVWLVVNVVVVVGVVVVSEVVAVDVAVVLVVNVGVVVWVVVGEVDVVADVVTVVDRDVVGVLSLQSSNDPSAADARARFRTEIAASHVVSSMM